MGEELVALGGALLAAGILARLGRRVGLPTIPFFMVAGIIFGPETPGFELVEHPEDLELVAALGLILLLFHLGLEFSLGELAAGGRRLLAAGAVYLALNVGGGLALRLCPRVGQLRGARHRRRHRDLLVGDRHQAAGRATPAGQPREPARSWASSSSRTSSSRSTWRCSSPCSATPAAPGEAAVDVAVAFAFLLALAGVARWGSALVGRLIATSDDELLTVCFVGVAVLIAGIAEQLGVSGAIGAFMAGLILAESPVAGRIEQLVLPLRDTFAAVFFFAFGLTIAPGDAADVAVPVALAIVVTAVLTLTAGVIVAADVPLRAAPGGEHRHDQPRPR